LIMNGIALSVMHQKMHLRKHRSERKRIRRQEVEFF